MNKNRIRLTESQLHRVIKESVKNALREMSESNHKYLWYSPDYGLSDDFNSEEECTQDAVRMNKEYPSEYGIYSYDANQFPDGNVEQDDCEYIGFVGEGC